MIIPCRKKGIQRVRSCLCLTRKPVHCYHQHTKCTTVLNQVQYIFP